MSRADATKEFLLSSTYGLLAGTLVGAATLAFEDKPGDNLKNIAQGASLGLYGGMLLGLYLIYAVPSANEQPGDYQDLSPSVPVEEEVYQEETKVKTYVFPVISENKIDGLGVGISVMAF